MTLFRDCPFCGAPMEIQCVARDNEGRPSFALLVDHPPAVSCAAVELVEGQTSFSDPVSHAKVEPS